MKILPTALYSALKTKVRIWDPLAKPKGKNIVLKTHRENLITWYACGPTVYDSAHIGHASSYVRLDIIRRILERQNFTVLQVMGVTDIDDKIINKANRIGIQWDTLARKFEMEFVKELQALNVKPPFIRARATAFIPQIITFVQNLLHLGFAYSGADGSIYFNTAAHKQYGIFSSVTGETESEELCESSSHKKNKKDFALWKASKPNEPFWLSPWGKGRPGWHIECSVIASHFFGKTLDIHSGGSDLMFPHHENEEAQCCAHYEMNKWVTHWIHTGHLLMKDGGKMSKSLGNTLSISEFLKSESSNSLRMLCLMHSHRTHLLYSPEFLNSAKSFFKKFQNFLDFCSDILEGTNKVKFDSAAEEYLWDKLAKTKVETQDALCNDFDTVTALKFLSEFVSAFNRKSQQFISIQETSNSDSVDYELILASKSFVCEFFENMGFQLEHHVQPGQIENEHLFEPILEEFVVFRQSVRSFCLAMDERDQAKRIELMIERRQLVVACDQVRRNLGNYGVKIKDYGERSSWCIQK